MASNAAILLPLESDWPYCTLQFDQVVGIDKFKVLFAQ